MQRNIKDCSVAGSGLGYGEVDDVVQNFTGVLVLKSLLVSRRGGWKEPNFL